MNAPMDTEPLPIHRLARVIRSKNAGPATLTLDLIFDDTPAYERVVAAKQALLAEIAARYDTRPEDIRIIPYPVAHAIKIALPRRHVAGAFGDMDAYGAQQHRPLMDISL